MVEPLAISGADLRAERQKAGILLQDLAEILDIDQSVLSRMETRGNRTIDPEFAERYFATVRRTARERAEAVGALDTPSDTKDSVAA